MAKKEIKNKIHKIRRGFLVGVAVTALSTVALGASVAIAGAPILTVMNASLLTFLAGISISAGVAANKVYEIVGVQKNKRGVRKGIEKIRELNFDKTSNVSQKDRAKVVVKYANQNLKLCKSIGETAHGAFVSNLGTQSRKAVELINRIDNLSILKEATSSDSKKQKYDKKLRLSEQKLSKIVAEEGIVSPKCKWTMSYNDAMQGVSVVDRRTEIACHTQECRDAFKTMFENQNVKGDSKCLNVTVTFNSASNLAPTYARVEDQTKEQAVFDMLKADIVYACAKMQPEEVLAIFPITIEKKILDKKSAKITQSKQITFNSLSDLRKNQQVIVK